MDSNGTARTRRSVLKAGWGGVLALVGVAAVAQTSRESEHPALAPASPAASPDPMIETHAIQTIGLRFSPARITVRAGTPFRLRVTNESAVVHDLVIPALGFRTSRLLPGETDDLLLNLEAGTYAFNCSIQSHWQAGMEGELVVE